MAERNRPHIVVGADHTASESFTSTRSGPSGSESPPSPPDRGAHRDKLTREMAAAIALAETIRSELPDDTPRPDGVYLTFESYEGTAWNGHPASYLHHSRRTLPLSGGAGSGSFWPGWAWC